MDSVRYGAAVGLRYGAAVGRICGAAAWGLSYGAALILGSPTFPRAHVLLVALLVGLRCGAAPQKTPASPHNLLEARLLPSVGRWTSLLVGSLLIASLPLVRPPSARWGALFRAAARFAVTSAIMAAAAPPLFSSIRSAVGLSPSPQSFALVLCGLAMGEELGPIGRLLHPPRDGSGVGREGARLPVGSDSKMAPPSAGWRLFGALWAVVKMAAGWGGKMAARGGAVLFKMAAAAASRWSGRGREGGGGKMAAGGGGMETEESGKGSEETGSGLTDTGSRPGERGRGVRETGSGVLETGSRAIGTGSAAPRARGESFGTGSGFPKTGSGAAATGRGPSASTPHFLLFLLNAALLLLLQGALAAISAPGAGLGAGLGWAGHALTYGLWFRCPYSPGRPAVGLRTL